MASPFADRLPVLSVASSPQSSRCFLGRPPRPRARGPLSGLILVVSVNSVGCKSVYLIPGSLPLVSVDPLLSEKRFVNVSAFAPFPGRDAKKPHRGTALGEARPREKPPCEAQRSPTRSPAP